jgi:DNA mismatch repair protein MutL
MPTPIIQTLDPLLVNKIAAGEVIERPASVVKELMENALDAGATRIDVELEQGGAALIRVSDDGHGIDRENLARAVAPHATSKIRTCDDLFAIRTLGFRGEALASIAAVSRLRITSRPADAESGFEVLSADGALIGPRACARSPGTTVEAAELFHNVPARRKFLRQPGTEFAQASEQVLRLAMAHPPTAFKLSHNGREARALPATADRRARIADAYGPELADALLPIRREEYGLGIEAWIAPPAGARATSKWQYLFLNGRYIIDRRISYAIREAFRGLVEHDRYPVTFIFLAANPSSFDVNVHPTKIEVRWRDAALVQSIVLAALRETLLSHDLTPRLQAAPPRATILSAEEALRNRRQAAEFLKAVDPVRGPQMPASRWATDPRPRAEERPPPLDAPSGSAQSPAFPADATSTAHAIGSPLAGDERPPAPTPVLQVHNTYIVAQSEEGLLIIDQHAMHERILYEQFRDRVLAGPLESQRLLIPATIEVSAVQAETARAAAPLLAQLGVELSEFGPGALAVDAFPVLLSKVEIRGFVVDLLDQLGEAGSAASEETLLRKALDLMACKAAVKAGDPLSQEEMRALLESRRLGERSSNCPHGRPTTLQLSRRDLDRQFKRT